MSPSRQRGFSLLEALVAVAISSIGLAGVYAMVSHSIERLDNATQRQSLQAVASEILGVMDANVDELTGFQQSLTDCANLPDRIGSALTDDNKSLMLSWCQRLEVEQGVATVQATRSITVSAVARADGVSFRVVNLELTDAQGQTRVAFKRIFRETQ